MALEQVHPRYDELSGDWEFMDVSYLGQDAIKAQGEDLLFPTSAMTALGMANATQEGRKMFEAYKGRANYPEYLKEGVEQLLGMLWVEGPTIELPAAMEYMLERATLQGEGLEQVLLRIHEAQLVKGRMGALLDLAVDKETNTALPYIALYDALAILNWDRGKRDDVNPLETLKLVVLDESEYERQDDLSWELITKYRVLSLGDPRDLESEEGVYIVATANEDNADLPPTEEFVTPNVRGNTLDAIPFVFINTKDILPDPDQPPLKPIANLAVAIYRGDADYRQTLFMQSQDTLVIIGRNETDPVRIGAGATIDVPLGADAKYIGVGHEGLNAQRQALEDDKTAAQAKLGSLVDQISREKESGAAIGLRVGAKTASLTQIAKTSAHALERLLKMAAVWIGANPEEVKVTPNLDFVPNVADPATVVALTTAKNSGAPISKETIHANMKRGGLTELTFEEEMDKIDGEVPTGTTALGPDGLPLDPAADPNATLNPDDEANDDNRDDTAPAT